MSPSESWSLEIVAVVDPGTPGIVYVMVNSGGVVVVERSSMPTNPGSMITKVSFPPQPDKASKIVVRKINHDGWGGHDEPSVTLN